MEELKLMSVTQLTTANQVERWINDAAQAEPKVDKGILDFQMPLPTTASLISNTTAIAAEMTGDGHLTLNIVAGQAITILLRASRDDVQFDRIQVDVKAEYQNLFNVIIHPNPVETFVQFECIVSTLPNIKPGKYTLWLIGRGLRVLPSLHYDSAEITLNVMRAKRNSGES